MIRFRRRADTHKVLERFGRVVFRLQLVDLKEPFEASRGPGQRIFIIGGGAHVRLLSSSTSMNSTISSMLSSLNLSASPLVSSDHRRIFSRVITPSTAYLSNMCLSAFSNLQPSQRHRLDRKEDLPRWSFRLHRPVVYSS